MEIRVMELRRAAKAALRNHYGNAILGSILVLILTFFGSSLTSTLIRGNGTMTLILQTVFAFLVSLLIYAVMAGYYVMLLKRARGETESIGDLFCFFRTGVDRVLVAGFFKVVLEHVTEIPLLLFLLRAPEIVTEEEFLLFNGKVLLISLLILVVESVLSIPLSLSYYLLYDDPALGGVAAVKKSCSMMMPYVGKYLLLLISFIPLFIGSVFTFYLGLLWVIPYLRMTQTEFYLALLENNNVS